LSLAAAGNDDNLQLCSVASLYRLDSHGAQLALSIMEERCSLPKQGAIKVQINATHHLWESGGFANGM